MNAADRKSFAQIITGLSEYYGKPVSTAVIEIYWQGLERYDLAAIDDAVNRHMRNPDAGQYMPKIADLVRMLEGGTLDSALGGWTKFDRAVRSVGPYQSVIFDDPIIHAVVCDMGGWIGFGSKTEEEWPFIAKEFQNRYRGYRARGGGMQYPSRLLGLSEVSAIERDMKPPMPTLIGDPQTALLVEQAGVSRKHPVEITRAPKHVLRLVANGGVEASD